MTEGSYPQERDESVMASPGDRGNPRRWLALAYVTGKHADGLVAVNQFPGRTEPEGESE